LSRKFVDVVEKMSRKFDDVVEKMLMMIARKFVDDHEKV
jgi:hypothetical protein